MPHFCCQSKVRVDSDHCTLIINLRHRLLSGTKSGSVRTIKSKFPANVDVLLASDLILTLSGVVDRVKVSSQDVSDSAAAQHLRSYLDTNASRLGLNTVSGIYIDDEDGLPKLTLTSSRSLVHNPRHPYVLLVGIDICYTWITKTSETCLYSGQGSLSADSHPFSRWLLLPLEFLLNDAVYKFVTWHLVRRYPLIFGLWCQKLDAEIIYFSPMTRCISNMMERSHNSTFRGRCERLIEVGTLVSFHICADQDCNQAIKSHHQAASSATSSALSVYLGGSLGEDSLQLSEASFELNGEEAMCLSMDQLFRDSIRRPMFKTTSVRSRAASLDLDNDDEDPSQKAISHEDTNDSESLAWNELSVWPNFEPQQSGPLPTFLDDSDQEELPSDDDEDSAWFSSGPLVDVDSDLFIDDPKLLPPVLTTSQESSEESFGWADYFDQGLRPHGSADIERTYANRVYGWSDVSRDTRSSQDVSIPASVPPTLSLPVSASSISEKEQQAHNSIGQALSLSLLQMQDGRQVDSYDGVSDFIDHDSFSMDFDMTSDEGSSDSNIYEFDDTAETTTWSSHNPIALRTVCPLKERGQDERNEAGNLDWAGADGRACTIKEDVDHCLLDFEDGN